MTQDEFNLDSDAPSTSYDDGEELNSGNIGGNYIRMPKVGEQITVEVFKFIKTDKDLVIKGRKGEPDIILAPKTRDGVASSHKYVIKTRDGKELTIPNWEVIGKLRGFINKLGAEASAVVSLSGQTILINHKFNGMDPQVKKSGADCYVVALKKSDGKFYELSKATNEWKEVSA